ncbi:hypothetical protein CRG98_037659 [Punica granatum]|uniref:G-patch domain-containing protein n=1 Tax=Punica granatum TaxID=22663 RepID=A0A2I0ID82_PUNGR|nr:hypothetical protein CRG98_037659 [Punica granatum]
MPWVVGVGLWMSAVYSSIVGANSVPWKLNTVCSGSQNSMAVLKKIQSTGVSEAGGPKWGADRGHSYVEALLAEIVRSLDYVREVRRGRIRGSPHLLQIWLLVHVRPFCSSHPFSYIADKRSLIERRADRLPYRIQWADSTSTAPARFLQIREIHRQRDASTIQRLYFPEHPSDEERALSATSAYVAQFYSPGSTSPQRSQTTPTPRVTPTPAPEAESSTQAAMRVELRAIREERDRLCCELVDSCAEVADYRELQTEQGRAGSPILRISGRTHFAPARTYTALDRLPSAKGCRLTFMFIFLRAERVRDVEHLERDAERARANVYEEIDLPVHLPVIATGVTPIPNSSTCQDGGRGPHRYLRGSQSTDPGTFSAAPDVCSTTSNSRGRTSDVFRRPFDASPAPDVFRGAPPMSLTDVIHLRRPCSHCSTRGHSQPISCEHDHQHGGVVRPTQRTEPRILKLHTTFGDKDPRPTQHLRFRQLKFRKTLMFPHYQRHTRPRLTHLPFLIHHHRPPQPSLFHRWRSSLRTRSYPRRHLFPCRPQLQPIPSLRRRQVRLDPTHATATLVYSRACGYPRRQPVGIRSRLVHVAESRRYSDVGRPLPEVYRPVPILCGNSSDPLGIEHERDGARPKIRGILHQMACPILGERHVCTPRGPHLCSAISASTPYPTDLLFCTTTSTPTYGAVARCPPLYPYSTPSPSIPTPGSEGFSANTTNSTLARSTGRCGTTATPWAILIPACPAFPHLPHMRIRGGRKRARLPLPFVIEYIPAGTAVGFAGIDASPTPFVIDIPAREPYSDDKMNVDLNRVRPSKTSVRAFDGLRREVNGEIDLLIDVGPCSFSVTFQVLDIPNAFSLLLGRPWIHSAGAIPSSLHQKLKFVVEERIIMVKGKEDYAIYKETSVPYISVENDENLPFHSFKTISVIRDYREIGPSRADRMIGKVLLCHNYIPGTGVGARGKGINRPIEENEELNNWTSVPRYSAMIANVLHSNPNYRHVDSNPPEECLGEPGPIYFGEGLDEDSQIPKILESLRRLEDRQLTSLEQTEEINVGTEDGPRTLKIGTGLDPTQ